MDILSLIRSDQTFPLELLHPATEEPLGITVHIRSDQSDEVKRATRANQDKVNLRLQKGKTIKSAMGEANATERVMAMIADWEWNSDLPLVEGEGKPDCNEKNKRLLAENDYFFDQIEEAATTAANFTAKGKNASKTTSKSQLNTTGS